MLSQEAMLANSALLLRLLQRLIGDWLMPREQLRATLVDAADALVSDPNNTSSFHVLAVQIIRKELMPKV